ncbi:MAG: DUF2330 domain-containing protein [Deltaproteobacteria bacterium]|nr:DUF2330 domain-containing protein [Deltaproteobacteria bacterium]
MVATRKRRAAATLGGLASATAFCGLLGLAVPAWACGGFAGPVAVQDSQWPREGAERVLFIRAGDGRLRVWIEISHVGPAEAFAWVMPVPAETTVRLGSRTILDRIDQATALRRTTSGLLDRDEAVSVQFNVGCSGDAGGGGSGGLIDGSAVSTSTARVGPYEVTTLTAPGVAPLQSWLDTNGFALPPEAAPALADHVARGHRFVAMRLLPTATANDIRPVIFDMPDTEPCMPLRLSAASATARVKVAATFIGPGRAVPANMLHLRFNPLLLGWSDPTVGSAPFAPDELRGAAVDAAGGRGFFTTSVARLDDALVPTPPHQASAAALARAVEYQAPLASGYGWGDGYMRPGPLLPMAPDLEPLAKATTAREVHDALLAADVWITRETAPPIAAEFPPPDGPCAAVTATDPEQRTVELVLAWLAGSYRCGPSIWGWPTPAPMNGAAIASALRPYLVDPAERLDALRGRNLVLTRLDTSLAPGAIDRDPTFRFVPMAEPVSPDVVAAFESNESVGVFRSGEGAVVLYDTTHDAMAAAKVAIEQGQPALIGAEVIRGDSLVPVAPAQRALVDEAIRGATEGSGGVPTSLVLQADPSPWTPPRSQALPAGSIARLVQSDSSGCNGGAAPIGRALLPLLLGAITLLWRRMSGRR